MSIAEQIAQPRAVVGMSTAERRDLALYRVMRSLPVSVASRVGAALSQSMGRRSYPNADARVAAGIRRLRPDLASTPAVLEATQVRFWAHVGRIYAEYCLLHKMVPRGRVDIDDRDTFKAVLTDGRPVIVPFVHLGNWETCGSVLSLNAPGRVCALSNPMPPNRIQAQIATLQHARLPGKVLTFDSNVWRRALHHLEQSGGILFAAVDEVMAGRVSAPCFGRPLAPGANVHKIVRIAARIGAIILPIYSERLEGARFCTRILKPLEFQRQRRLEADEQLLSALKLAQAYEAPILRLIDQWFGLLDFRE
jgi:Kdo2-lipid IVA lauroyltransferase/acyltransferase